MRSELAAGLFTLVSLVGFTVLHLSTALSEYFPSPLDPLLKEIVSFLINNISFFKSHMPLIIKSVKLFDVILWRIIISAIWIIGSAMIGRRLAAGPVLDSTFPKDLTGKVALITGCSAGTIGFWTAFHLAARGATVIIGCRSEQRSQQAADAIKKAVKERFGEERASRLRMVTNMGSLELESFQCVREFAKSVNDSGLPLHILVNNAGLIPSSKQRCSTLEPNVELSTCVNFLAPYLLTELLAPLIQRSKGRVVFVSSSQHAQIPYDPLFASRLRKMSEGRHVHSAADLPSPILRYNYAKLGNIFTAHHTVTKWNIPTCVLHPGFVATSIMGSHLPKWVEKLYQQVTIYFLTKTDEEGATTSLHCSLVPEEQIMRNTKPFQTRNTNTTTTADQKRTGMMAPYYCDCVVEEPSELAQDERVYEEVMEWARKTVNF